MTDLDVLDGLLVDEDEAADAMARAETLPPDPVMPRSGRLTGWRIA